jgi:hypothetical protein
MVLHQPLVERIRRRDVSPQCGADLGRLGLLLIANSRPFKSLEVRKECVDTRCKVGTRAESQQIVRAGKPTRGG